MVSVANSLLLKAGKRVVIIPKACDRVDAEGPTRVAWDGSLAAMAALTAAVSLLKLARAVRILEIQGSSRGPSAKPRPISRATGFMRRSISFPASRIRLTKPPPFSRTCARTNTARISAAHEMDFELEPDTRFSSHTEVGLAGKTLQYCPPATGRSSPRSTHPAPSPRPPLCSGRMSNAGTLNLDYRDEKGSARKR